MAHATLFRQRRFGVLTLTAFTSLIDRFNQGGSGGWFSWEFRASDSADLASAFTKGLSRSQAARPDPDTCGILRCALSSCPDTDFEPVRPGSGCKFANPHSAFASHIDGGAARIFCCPLTPRFSSRSAAKAMTTLYLRVLHRHIPFHGHFASLLVRQVADAQGTLAADVSIARTECGIDGISAGGAPWAS